MHICVVSVELSLFFPQIQLDENLYFHVGNFQCSKGNLELWFLCFALCLLVLNICVKFHENISVLMSTEWTRVCGRNGNFQCSKGNNSKSMQSRVTVPVLCMSSHSA